MWPSKSGSKQVLQQIPAGQICACNLPIAAGIACLLEQFLSPLRRTWYLCFHSLTSLLGVSWSLLSTIQRLHLGASLAL